MVQNILMQILLFSFLCNYLQCLSGYLAKEHLLYQGLK